jgi:hypothetical protein
MQFYVKGEDEIISKRITRFDLMNRIVIYTDKSGVRGLGKIIGFQSDTGQPVVYWETINTKEQTGGELLVLERNVNGSS